MATGAIHLDRCYPDNGRRMKFMTQSSGYVMVRRPHAMPFVMAERKWINLPLWVEAG